MIRICYLFSGVTDDKESLAQIFIGEENLASWGNEENIKKIFNRIFNKLQSSIDSLRLEVSEVNKTMAANHDEMMTKQDKMQGAIEAKQDETNEKLTRFLDAVTQPNPSGNILV